MSNDRDLTSKNDLDAELAHQLYLIGASPGAAANIVLLVRQMIWQEIEALSGKQSPHETKDGR